MCRRYPRSVAATECPPVGTARTALGRTVSKAASHRATNPMVLALLTRGICIAHLPTAGGSAEVPIFKLTHYSSLPCWKITPDPRKSPDSLHSPGASTATPSSRSLRPFG